MTTYFRGKSFRVLRARLFLAAASVLAVSGLASAQTLNFSVGAFVPRGDDARVTGDVLEANRTFLSFDISDFNGALAGGEWLLPVGEYFEVGAGVGFYRRSVNSVYSDYIDRDGSEIEQTLRLRLIPAAFTVRMVLTGSSSAIQPYFGGGLGVTNWRYSESGEFVNFNLPGQPIVREAFADSGTVAGAVALAGLRFQGNGWVTGGEVRYSKAEADLVSDFAGDRIDLGGWTYQFTIGRRF